MTVDIRHCRHEEMTRTLPDGSVNLIVTDPPYFRVKSAAWDRQWKSDAAFLAWMGEFADEWRRILAPNGSLYVFASPQMAARVECVVRERFNVLSSLVWAKADAQGNGISKRTDPKTLRSWFHQSERIIFAEHHNPTGARLARARSGRPFVHVARALGVDSRLPALWELPRDAHGACEPSVDQFSAALRFWGDSRADADIRREYDDLRRPFNADRETFTDVWTFPTVPARKGKHPCEKPPEMAEHIIAASSRPGDVVFDGFCGSGVFLKTAARLGRVAWGCDMDEWWAQKARRDAEVEASRETAPVGAPASTAAAPRPAQLSLFGAA